jgi:hypothetical protein
MRFFNHADYRVVARGRGADATRFNVCEVVTDGAENDSQFDFPDRIDQTVEIVVGRAHDVKRQPLRRLVSDAGQAFQFVDEFRDGLGVFQHFANFGFRNSKFRIAF